MEPMELMERKAYKVQEDLMGHFSNGINGTQGPPGITQLIPGTNVYLVTNSSGFVNINTPINVQALCQPGDFVIDGGYNYDYTTFTQFLFIGKSQPIISPSGAGSGSKFIR